MKCFSNLFLIGLALCFATLVGAAPAPDIHTVTTANVDADQHSAYHTFNITIPEISNTIEARGYDHSTEWQGYAQVEVWTGGDKRKPINWGNLRGPELSKEILRLLDITCPWESSDSFFNHKCGNHDWQFFKTKTIVESTPIVFPFKTETRRASFKTEHAEYATLGVRNVMAKIIAETLAAYTKNEKGYNCYEYSREIFCNVPRKVRVNLPYRCKNEYDGCLITGRNRWQIVTSSAHDPKEFSPFGDLRPCKTRPEVDMVMDKYKDDVVKEFPKYKFSRDARVIINGDKVCSSEL